MKTKEVLDRGEQAAVLIFDDATSQVIEVDFRGSIEDVSKRIADQQRAKTPQETEVQTEVAREASRGVGRPRLGVVGREVTLLPRHWEWLNQQPGGASVALRKLVEEARRVNEPRDRARKAQDAAYRFMSAMAGNLPDFEEATRALFAADTNRLQSLIQKWPPDVRTHLMRLVDNWKPLQAQVTKASAQ